MTKTAFVLGGGGILGSVEVGMLRALLEYDVRPDLVVGTSIGALNGLAVAKDPSLASVDRLEELWREVAHSNEVYSDPLWRTARRALATRTNIYSAKPLERRLRDEFGDLTFADLAVPFQCVASSIERSAETWFAEGPVVPAVMASAAVPGFFAPQKVGDEHFLDGGIVNSIPLGRAVELGATKIYVLQVGRIDRPLKAPKRPWDVARVSFEIARRHRFMRELANLPEGVVAHVLPAGGSEADDSALAYRDGRKIAHKMVRAYQQSLDYLDQRTK